MVNRVTLIGNLGKDAEFRTFENGNAFVRFPLATHENYLDKSGNWQKSTEWHHITAWGKLADRLKMLRQGTLVYIEGKITTRKFQDKEGHERQITEISAQSVRILEKRENPGDHSNRPHNNGGQTTDVNPSEMEGNDTSFHGEGADDLPF
jgi:single-strand DNA-binding protein